MLRQAIESYKEDTLRGLGGLCDDEIAERVAEFKAKHKPVDGTEEELAAFAEKLTEFVAMLHKIRDRSAAHSLLTVGVHEDAYRGMDKSIPYEGLRVTMPASAVAGMYARG